MIFRHRVIATAVLTALAGQAAAAPPQDSAAGGSPEPVAVTRPWTAGELDCAAFAIDASRWFDLILVPRPTDAAQIYREVFPDGPPLAKLKQSLEVDPGGLCRYRDENRKLPPPTPRRVVFMGDSITEIWGGAAPALFTGEVIDRGVSGQNTSQMLLRFRDDVLALKPAVVHIMAGINDINTPAGTALTRANIASMVDLAQAHGVRVVLGTITPCASFFLAPEVKPAPQIRALNTWLKDFAGRRGLALVDYYTPLVDSTGGLRTDLTNDGLHPNARGYAVITPLAAAAVAAALP